MTTERPYPDGIAWDEALRQRLRAVAAEAENTTLRGLLREVQFDAVTSLEWRSRVRAALEAKP